MDSVVLINPPEVPGGTDDEFLRRCNRAAAYPQNQPGPVGAHPHRALRPDARFVGAPLRTNSSEAKGPMINLPRHGQQFDGPDEYAQ